MTSTRNATIAAVLIMSLAAAASADPTIKAGGRAGKASSTPRIFLYAKAGEGGQLQLRNMLEPEALSLLEWSDYELGPDGSFTVRPEAKFSGERINEKRLGEGRLWAIQYKLRGLRSTGGKLYVVSFAEADLPAGSEGPLWQPGHLALSLGAKAAAAEAGYAKGRGRILDAAWKDGVFTYKVAIAPRAGWVAGKP